MVIDIDFEDEAKLELTKDLRYAELKSIVENYKSNRRDEVYRRAFQAVCNGVFKSMKGIYLMKYRKKLGVVEAYQTDRETIIHTLEGVMHASVGDWIITEVNGEQYPCKPDIFEKTYEPMNFCEKKEKQ